MTVKLCLFNLFPVLAFKSYPAENVMPMHYHFFTTWTLKKMIIRELFFFRSSETLNSIFLPSSQNQLSTSWLNAWAEISHFVQAFKLSLSTNDLSISAKCTVASLPSVICHSFSLIPQEEMSIADLYFMFSFTKENSVRIQMNFVALAQLHRGY